MTPFRCLIAAVVLAIPAFLASAPAEALTARQLQAQGRGHYISSTGGRMGGTYYRARRHHRHYR